MQSNGARLAVLAVAIAAVVVLFVVLKGGDDDNTTTTSSTTTSAAATPDDTGGGGDSGDKAAGGGGEADAGIAVVELKGGQPVGGVQDLEFTSGGAIQFEVTSDEDAEIHFHGYDIGQEVEPGGSTTFDIPADIEGVFEVEIEDTAVPIAEVTVSPS